MFNICCKRYIAVTCFNSCFGGIVSKTRSFASSSNIGTFLKSWIAKLEEHEIPDAETSVNIIASSALNISNLDELPKFYSQALTEDQLLTINRHCECRLARVPVQYIIRDWDFRFAKLQVIPPVFIPRPETEYLVDIVRQSVKKHDRVFEIGCGSGAISISLLQENECLRMVSVDRSRLACDLTRQNAIKNGVYDRLEVHEREIQDNGSISNFDIGKVDAIVSSPPYIFSSELCNLEPEVKLFEDSRALDGGADGLRVIKAILKYSSVTLTPGGSCFLEVHHHHAPLIEKWLSKNDCLNLKVTATFKDVFGYERFVTATKIR